MKEEPKMATIRLMTPADLPAMAALVDQAVREGLVGRPLWETEADAAAELGMPRRVFVVAEDDAGALLGMAGYRLRHSGEAEIYGPLVTVEGEGVGAWLETRITTLAEQAGATGFSLLLGRENKSGQAWAEWRGYLRDTESPELLITWLYPGELQAVGLGEGRVRRAIPADVERIEALVHDCLPHRRTVVASWLENAWVIEAGGTVAGCLRLEPVTAEVDYLCVDPSQRRRGLGARLLADVVLDYWRTEPHRKLVLGVPLDDVAPVSLFRRMGFRREVAAGRWIKR